MRIQRLEPDIRPARQRQAGPRTPPNRAAEIALIGAAAAALISWTALVVLARRRGSAATRIPMIDPNLEFEQALTKVERMSGRAAASALADAVRRYAARTEPRLSGDLTTTEFLRTLESASVDAERTALVRTILESGDMAKFAPWAFNGEVVATSVARSLLVRRSDASEAAA